MPQIVLTRMQHRPSLLADLELSLVEQSSTAVFSAVTHIIVTNNYVRQVIQIVKIPENSRVLKLVPLLMFVLILTTPKKCARNSADYVISLMVLGRTGAPGPPVLCHATMVLLQERGHVQILHRLAEAMTAQGLATKQVHVLKTHAQCTAAGVTGVLGACAACPVGSACSVATARVRDHIHQRLATTALETPAQTGYALQLVVKMADGRPGQPGVLAPKPVEEVCRRDPDPAPTRHHRYWVGVAREML